MENEHFLNLLMDMGECLLSSGGEIYRVEKTINYMAESFGADRVDTFVINSSIVVSLHKDGNCYTQTRRIHSITNNLSRIEDINSLSRKFCRGILSVADAAEEVKRINQQEYSPLFFYFGEFCFGFGVAILFNGTFNEAMLSGLIGMLIKYMDKVVHQTVHNNISCSFIDSLFISILISILSKTGLYRMHILMISAIMSLIPGMAMTTSIRDILLGDTISGIMRFIESVFITIVLVFGFMIAIYITGGVI